MEYVNLGKAGVKVSRIALGLGFRGLPTDTEAQRVVEHAIDSGINFLDCANTYGMNLYFGKDRIRDRGSAERVLGRAIKGKRDDVVITTKVFGSLGEGPNDRGLSRYHIMREIERSLTRIGTDHLDIYLLHGFDDATPQDETLRALDDLITQGKIRYAGCCNFAAWQVCKALWTQDRLGADPFVCVQNPYNLLNRSLEREMFGLVRDSGLGVMVYSPLAVGILTGAYRPGVQAGAGTPWGERQEELASIMADGGAALLDVVRGIARDHGKTMAQVAVNWVLSHSEITVAISGSDAVEHVDDVLGGLGWALSESEIARLNEASEGMGNAA